MKLEESNFNKFTEQLETVGCKLVRIDGIDDEIEETKRVYIAI